MLVATVSFVAATPSVAMAGEDALPDGIHWYRESLAAAYAVPIGGGTLVATGVGLKAYPLALVGIVPLAFGGIVPPIVHWAHGNVWRGFLSIGGQSLGVTLALVSAMQLSHCKPSSDFGPSDCFVSNWGAAGAIGTAAWAAPDIAFLAYEEDEGEPARDTSALRLLPVVTPLPGGGALGLAVGLP